jgi:zinc D-Ala-D-Ala dipeptidase
MTFRFLQFTALCFLFACQSSTPESKIPENQPQVKDTISATANVSKTDTAIVAVTPPVDTPKLVEKIVEKVLDPILPATPAQKKEPKAPKRDEKSGKTISAANFTDIESLDKSIKLDIRYATKNNFTKAQIYDCPKCYLRPEAALAIEKAHKELQKQGLGLKMFDCYRPRPYQQRLWDKVPNPDYVTPPAKGSMHGRGAAVDLTIVDKNGKEVDMGTEYDFFGEEAHYDYTKLSEKILSNRKLLRSTLEKYGFAGIRTEWWHFSYKLKEYPLSVELWECN